jgi:hypothetical protein
LDWCTTNVPAQPGQCPYGEITGGRCDPCILWRDELAEAPVGFHESVTSPRIDMGYVNIQFTVRVTDSTGTHTESSCQKLWKLPVPPAACFELGRLQIHELSVDEAPSTEDELTEIAAANPPPVLAQPLDQLEDQVLGVLSIWCPLGDSGASAHAGEDRLDRVGGPQVQPMLLREVVEGQKVGKIAQDGFRGDCLSCLA